jgi:hypothetical protein
VGIDIDDLQLSPLGHIVPKFVRPGRGLGCRFVLTCIDENDGQRFVGGGEIAVERDRMAKQRDRVGALAVINQPDTVGIGSERLE